MDLDTLDWSDDLLEAMGIPRSMMARILPSVGRVGTGTGVLEGGSDLGDPGRPASLRCSVRRVSIRVKPRTPTEPDAFCS